MASPAYEQILEIQSLDLHLTQLRHRLDNHPARAEVAEAEAAMATIEVRLEEIDGRRHELDRSLKRLSDEVETIEQKRTEVDAKLYDGSVTASKDLLALQDEAASLLDRQRGMEDDELEIMEQLEAVGDETAAARDELAVVQARRDQSLIALDEATTEIKGEIEAATQQRSTAVEPALPELLARYEALAKDFGGVAVARLVDGRCDGCHMQLSAVAVDQLGKAPEDAVVTCEECGRLLVR